MTKDAIVRKIVLLLLPVFAALTGGCEDKIQVDLKNSEPRLVIEGHLSYRANESWFRLSRTTDFYQPNEVEGVSGALIVISDSGGFEDTLVEWSGPPGFYWNSKARGDFQKTYVATVTVDDKTYVASATMPLPIRIDSLGMSFQEGDGFGPEEDRGYRVHVFFRDRPGVPDYARIMLWHNRLFCLDYYLYDGKFSDGNVIDYDYFTDVFQIGDTVTAEIVSMDKTMYDYFVTLSEVAADKNGGTAFDATPANPNTNWSGEALGYFGAFNWSKESLIVGE